MRLRSCMRAVTGICTGLPCTIWDRKRMPGMWSAIRCMAAFEGIGKLRSTEAFRGWIFQILLNQCRKRRRQYMHKTEELTEELKERLPDAQMDPCESMDVRRAFQTLPEEDRMIVSLSVLGGYSSGEIGALLHRNANTVRSRLSRSMRRMQVLLEG